jgi:hypothetical protein
MLTRVFLRLYGFNLGRSSRNTPEQACGDALAQMNMVLAVPVGVLFIPVAILIDRLRSHDSAAFMLVAAVLLVLPIVFWVQSQFRGYRTTPEAAEAYRSRRERTKTAAFFVLAPVAVGVIAGVAIHLLRAHSAH